MTIYVKFTNGQPAFYDNKIHSPEQIPQGSREISEQVHRDFLENQGTKYLREDNLSLANIPRDFNEEKAKILSQIRQAHIEYMNQPKNVNNFWLPINDDSMQQFRTTLDDTISAGLSVFFTRDYYNNYIFGDVVLAEAIYFKLGIIKQLSFLKKWQIEKTYKECTAFQQLDQLPKVFEIKVTDDEINQLVNMTLEQRNQYIQQIASSFINI